MREHDDSRFRAPLPYPEVRVARPNPFYARVLHDDFAGRASELTAILQYLYHHWVSGPGGEEIPDLAGLYKGIARVEMSHFEMLAETILLLGGRPAFAGSDGRLWSPADVYPGEGICDRLAANLAGEEEAIATYQRQAAFVRDPYVSALLLRIAK
ncbi:MAG: manganese catalase family protein, partial [Firmicutes bacterium]|nr:manganese catalase family protein [Bacillota bacterium]